MIRSSILSVCAVVVIAAAFVTGASVPPKASEDPKASDGAVLQDTKKSIPVVCQKMGFFNMARVMRDYKRGKASVQRLNDRREQLSRNLIGMKAMQTELQSVPKETAPERREHAARELVLLSRKIEDMSRDIEKLLNNQAAMVITELYDEIYATTAELARERGLSVIFAYPDGTTPEERDNPNVKELKLKPPAAQPFYIDSSVDYSDELIERLNAKFAGDGDK